MEFKLTYSKEVLGTAIGVFVENPNMSAWMEAASALGTDTVRFYPIPGMTANSVVGALLIASEIPKESSTSYPTVYRVGAEMFALSMSNISPKMDDAALTKRLGATPHFFHPVYGLMELTEFTYWSNYLRLNQREIDVRTPATAPNVPDRLSNYYIREVPPEEVLKSLIERSVPSRSTFDDKPLSSWEKFKLKTYRAVLGKGGNDESSGAEGIEGAAAQSSSKKSWWKRKKEGMHQDMENLEERNKKELDKLMNLLKKDPDEALKYALPIDRSGNSRGPEVGFRMQRRSWGSGTFGTTGGGGNVSLAESETDILRRKYREIAAKYEEDQNWEKASFVHLELLSDPYSAANVLRKGKKYEAAAAIYLSKCKQTEQAAECYELGNFFGRAIDLNEELDRQEKVGDLYVKMGDKKKANVAYQKEVDKLITAGSYFNAGELSKGKMEDTEQARTHFLQGWETGRRPDECLNEYLNSHELNQKRDEIQAFHSQGLAGSKAHLFLDVLRNQQDQNIELKEDIHLIAHETIARNAKKDASIVNLLKLFRSGELVQKDAMRYKHIR